MANQEMIRIRLKAYDHQLIDSRRREDRRDRKAQRRQRLRPHPAADEEGSRHHPSRCSQV